MPRFKSALFFIFCSVISMSTIVLFTTKKSWSQNLPGENKYLESSPNLSGNDPHWIEDQNSKCWAFNPNSNPDSTLSISWSGACEAQLLNGAGTLTWSINGASVEADSGTFFRGKLVGSGEMQIFSTPGGFNNYEAYGTFVGGVLVGPVHTIVHVNGPIISEMIVDDQYSQMGDDMGGGTATEVDSDGTSHLGHILSGSGAFVSDDESKSSDQKVTNTNQDQVNQQIAGMVANGIAQSAGQFAQAQQNMAQVHEQVQQELAARNQQEAPAPVYTPPSAPVISPPQTDSSSDQQVASDGSSGADTVPVAESCISSFYDPNMYNWFTWKDNCSYPVNVYFRLQNNTAGYGTNNVIPGNKASGNTGQGKNDIAQGGGWVWGACPQGYGAFDYATNQRWFPSTTQYYCKRTSTGG